MQGSGEAIIPTTAREQRTGMALKKMLSGKDGIQLAIAIAILLLLLVVPALIGSRYWTYAVQIVCLYTTVAALQNILLIDAGQMSFGQGAIFGLAAYVAGAAFGLYGLPYGLAMLLGILAAAIGGLLFALPALKVQGFHLGFITLSAAIVFPEMVIALNSYTGGINGVVVTHSGFFDLRFLGIPYISWFAALLAMGTVTLHVYIRSTRFGRSMRVAAASPECAQSLGINPGTMRFAAFLIAAVGTGMAGSLYPPIVGIVSPEAFLLDLSILFFFSVIVGGRGEPLAAVLGVAVLYLVPNILLAAYTEYRLLAYGVIALTIMIFFPDGIVGSAVRWLERRQKTESEGGTIPIDLIVGHRSARAQSADRGQVVLSVRGARKSYGRVKAVDNIDFDLRRGEVHGLVGANGSGKTSLLNVLTGFSRLDAGELVINGQQIKAMPAHRMAKLGIGRTFQTPRIFRFFSTWENIEIGYDERVGPTDSKLEGAAEAIKEAVANRTADWLPHGQRRLVEMIRVVLKDADILLLDEPAAGLSPAERAEFSKLLRSLAHGSNKAIVLVEHDLQLVWGVADRVTVLETGRMVATGAPGEVRRDPAVSHLFVGASHA